MHANIVYSCTESLAFERLNGVVLAETHGLRPRRLREDHWKGRDDGDFHPNLKENSTLQCSFIICHFHHEILMTHCQNMCLRHDTS